MARTKQKTGEVSGRALVDIPAVNAKSGDYLTLPAEIAQPLIEMGDFDPQAQPPEEN